MVLQLHSITFNIDPSSAANSAMNIRRSEEYEISIPEFRKETANDFRFNCAAYAISETQGQDVRIHVQFVTHATADRNWEVKATGGGIMGSIDPVQFIFGPGETLATVEFSLPRRNFSKIGVNEIRWDWFYRLANTDSWVRLHTTRHRIYIVLSVPPAPWTQVFADRQNPWGVLLDECCRIAAGCKTDVKATRRITKAVNCNYHLRYDTDSGRPRYNFSSWSGWSFELENWIEFVLHSNVPETPRFCANTTEDYPDYWIINCYDAAGSLSLMSKVIGAQVEYHFHMPFGYLNRVYPIGRGICNNPFPPNPCSGQGFEVDSDATFPNRTGFGNHAYTKLNNRVFDACMKDFVGCLEKLYLSILIAVLILVTCGQADLSSLRDRYNGWLINLEQPNYDKYVIDTSTPQEAAAAGGSPVNNPVTF
jgi:hypothetical protein